MVQTVYGQLNTDFKYRTVHTNSSFTYL